MICSIAWCYQPAKPTLPWWQPLPKIALCEDCYARWIRSLR